jgi:hypothetical protein
MAAILFWKPLFKEKYTSQLPYSGHSFTSAQ